MNSLLYFHHIRPKTIRSMLRFKRIMAGHRDSSRAKNANHYDPSRDHRSGGQQYRPLPLPHHLYDFIQQEQLAIESSICGRPNETWGRWRQGVGSVKAIPEHVEPMNANRTEASK